MHQGAAGAPGASEPGTRQNRPMRIAMIGLRGVPATVGGIERGVEELGRELVRRGHEVTVYCRTNYVRERPPVFDGMRLRYLPTIGTKHLDAITHTALSTATALHGFDVVHFHAMGPGLLTPVARTLGRGTAVVQTIHGLDGERAKWGKNARRVLKFGEWLSARVPNETIVVSQALADHYQQRYGRQTTVIGTGVTEIGRRSADTIAQSFGLAPESYVLFVGRLVPEKQPDVLIRAFRQVSDDVRLVVAGGSSFTDDYVDELHRLAGADERVVITGRVSDEVLAELYSNALAYVTPSALEGAPLALLEAISTGLPIVASDIAPHVEVLGSETYGRRLFTAGDEGALALAIHRVIGDGREGREAARALREDILATHGWARVAEETERVYERALASRRGTGASAHRR